MKTLAEYLYCYLALLYFLKCCSSAVDFISANQTIRDGQTIVSVGENFEMGFFSPGNSTTRRYFGIWYKNIPIQTPVWVANRETPVTNTMGILRLDPDGVLRIQNATNIVIWSSNSSGPVSDPIAQLLDTGNLVIRDRSNKNGPSDHYIWQSFDFPGNTLIPGMKLGKDLVTGREWSYRSWKSTDDPSPGDFVIFLDTNGYPQNFVRKGSEIVFRSGPWNGLRFTGEPKVTNNSFYTISFVFNQKEAYYQDEQINSSVITRAWITPSGEVGRSLWDDSSQEWQVYENPQTDDCDNYGLCGVYGSCNINNYPACGCLQGFEPRFPQDWNISNWSGGCRRTIPLDCGATEGFRRYPDKKMPDTRHSWFNLSMNLDHCHQLCKSNCNCTAYANADISGSGSGCVIWFGVLIDTRDFPNRGQDIYIRMAASELALVNSRTFTGKDSKAKQATIIISVILTPAIGCGIFLFYIFKRTKLKGKGILERFIRQDYNRNEDLELPLFSFSTLLQATNNFATDNKLGEGAFGPVYKGKLLTGREIAVKRLSKKSWQGLREFKNEVLLISKLQHRNLVKILGYCFEGEERMIAYEYMSNKSLDSIIFDMEKRMFLTWQHCMAIGIGIAKGLLYLHHDSRLRIIHRDLKASNVLLDHDLNPKISDFGLARTFGGDQAEGWTKHVTGTYGYMSPEYAIRGKFSVKSDVFSFGVLLMEIVSGKKNSKYRHPDHHHSLLGHAWLLWKNGNALELLAANLEDSYIESQVLRFIQVSLLCVQKTPKDRPTMSSVVFMLSNEGAVLPQPKEPGFYSEGNLVEEDMTYGSLSEYTETITTLEAR